jgi:hypothetical protein
MDSKFPHTLAKRNVIGYKERFMDVESLSVWTPVLMVHIVQRCADISSGDASVPTPLWRHSAPIPPFMGEEVNTSQTYHSVGTECLHGRGVWGNARLRRAVSPPSI